MIEVVAAIIVDEVGRVLLVRKRGTLAYMQPGGKREPGETDLQTLQRELREELGCTLLADEVQAVGVFEAPAANEADEHVKAALYRVRIAGKPVPAAEIDDIVWMNPRRPETIALAPLTREHVLVLVNCSV